jgi:hypothetical protein
MKRYSIGFLLLIGFSVGIVYSQEESKGTYDWARKFFFDFSVLYNYEKLDPSPRFDAHNIVLEIGAGYDFGRITARLYGNFGFLAAGTAFWSNGTKPIKDSLDSTLGKFGIEAGVKIVDTSRFDLLIPLGLLFNWTTYTQKNPSYTTNNNPYDRKWEYDYMSIVSGIQAKITLGKHFSLCIPVSMGYPIVRNYTYKQILRGNYVWSDNNSATHSTKNDVDVLMLSAGIGVRFNF